MFVFGKNLFKYKSQPVAGESCFCKTRAWIYLHACDPFKNVFYLLLRIKWRLVFAHLMITKAIKAPPVTFRNYARVRRDVYIYIECVRARF